VVGQTEETDLPWLEVEVHRLIALLLLAVVVETKEKAVVT